jgi:hypothetical protein
MEKAPRPPTTEAPHDNFILRPKPDRRAHSRVQAVDLARQTLPPHDVLLTRIRAEYHEMPGLRLTPAQVQRLCGVEQALCRILLDTLVDEKFLCVKSDGHFARLTGDLIQHPQTAKADLRTGKRTKKAS